MNGKLYLGSIDVTKINKDKLYNGKYLNLTIFINDEPDKYGNHLSIQESVKKDEQKNYLGNAKKWGGGQESGQEVDNTPDWLKG